MATSLFCALSSNRIAAYLRAASQRVVYAAPGIQLEPANALVELARRMAHSDLTVGLDFDEQTLRMGYGDLEAVRAIREANIAATHLPGFRSGILIVDNHGWIFTPVPRYLEQEPQSDETPNAIALSGAQVEIFAVRFSAAARERAMTEESDPQKVRELAELPDEFGINSVSDQHFSKVEVAIQTAPPVKFDVVRQVRVFEPYLQYVELKLTGAAIQKHKVRIPADIQKLGSAADLEGRLTTTFGLIEKQSTLSSKKLEDDLNEIRKAFTPALGKHHGRVVLKSAKPLLERRISELEERLGNHQEAVRATLQKDLDKSLEQVVDYYLPLAQHGPPDSLVGQSLSGSITEADVRRWLTRRLATAFPQAEQLIQKMTLEVTFKDVTFETLNRPDFLESVRAAFPDVDWDKAYDEFRAAGETGS